MDIKLVVISSFYLFLSCATSTKWANQRDSLVQLHHTSPVAIHVMKCHEDLGSPRRWTVSPSTYELSFMLVPSKPCCRRWFQRVAQRCFHGIAQHELSYVVFVYMIPRMKMESTGGRLGFWGGRYLQLDEFTSWQATKTVTSWEKAWLFPF